jgi:hypothetical protein
MTTTLEPVDGTRRYGGCHERIAVADRAARPYLSAPPLTVPWVQLGVLAVAVPRALAVGAYVLVPPIRRIGVRRLSEDA